MTARPADITSTAAATGSYATAIGTTHHATDTSGVNNAFFAQPGVWGKLSSVGDGYISGHLSVIHKSCGQLFGSRQIEIEPTLTNGAPRTYLLGRIPAAGATNLRGSIIGNGLNDIEYQFRVRGVNDPDEPGSWTNVGSMATLSNGAVQICTTDASAAAVTPSDYHMLECGVMFQLQSAGSGPAGFLSVTAGLRYN